MNSVAMMRPPLLSRLRPIGLHLRPPQIFVRSLCKSVADGSSSEIAEELVNIDAKARQFAIRLTSDEQRSLVTVMDTNRDGLVQRSEYVARGREVLEAQWTKDVLLSAVEKPQSSSFLDTLGQRLVTTLDYFGTALFAVVGVQVAGAREGSVEP